MDESKGLKILIHASTWFAPILVPVIVFFLTTAEDVKRLSIQAIIFHLVIHALIWISVLFIWTLIAIPFLLIFAIIALVVPILGIVNAVQDRYFEYPIIGSFIK